MSSSAVDSSRFPKRGNARAGGSSSRRDALVARAKRGDLLALDLVLDEVLPPVTSICRPIAGPLWEDARQDALVVIFRRLRTLDRSEALFAWAATIARREALRHAHVRAGSASDEEPAAPELSAADISEVLARLPVALSEVLLLRDLIGFGIGETATLLGVPTGTVKSRLHRARRAFRETWAE